MTRTNGVGRPTPVRCAVYTRKSTDEGLEKEFNTLDAQRESAEAFIKSQQHAGWVCLKEHYDDGGASGATLERPALQRLLADVEAGRVNCVVVYKVDRLSRSLLDFTRLIDLFDQHKVSFVSVTQQFQTTTSMGRLTLNVLLSFAQFEREMIAERTRDKMGAARRKGKWVGGCPILGYDIDPKGGRIHVNPEEAARVRAIFDLYLELGSLDKVALELDRRQWKTKRWTTKRGGDARGGRPLSKNTVAHLLRHPYYVGKVRYRGAVYEGEHEAIVPQQVFAEVQRRLDAAVRPEKRPRRASGALLQGLLECAACGSTMAPRHTTKGPRRYLYYVCPRSSRAGEQRCPTPFIPRKRIEAAVVERLRAFGRRGGAVPDGVPGPADPARTACVVLDARWDRLEPDSRATALRETVRHVAYDASTSMLQIFLAGDHGPMLQAMLGLRTKRGQKDESAPADQVSEGTVPRVARLVALAHHFDGLLRKGVIKDCAEIARLGHVTRPRVTQILNLLHLAPDIQEELLFLPTVVRGRSKITEHALRSIAAAPLWCEQRRMFRALCERVDSPVQAGSRVPAPSRPPVRDRDEGRRW